MIGFAGQEDDWMVHVKTVVVGTGGSAVVTFAA